MSTLFRKLCKIELIEEIEGDLLEYYQLWIKDFGRPRANRLYLWHMLKFLRPFALKKMKHNNSNFTGLLQHNFLIGFRTLRKSKAYSIVTVGGLALGMSVAMTIGLWINDELNFNKYHDNYDRVVQVLRNQTHQGVTSTHEVQAPGVGTLLENDFGLLFERIAIVRSRLENRALAVGQKKYSVDGYFMQPDGPHIFGLKMMSGTRDGLREINSMFLSASLARKLFGDDDPLSKTVLVNAKTSMTVAGVYEDIPKNSDFHGASFFAPFDKYIEGWDISLNSWDNQFVNVYAQLRPEVEVGRASQQIKDAMLVHVDERTASANPELFLHPMKNWHLRSAFEGGEHVTSSRLRFVWIYAIVGLFVLLLACVNFMNLSTARSEKRANEIGVRKVLGSVRSQLVTQFLVESLIIAIMAFGLSCIVVSAVLPWFNELSEKALILPTANPWFWTVGLGFTLITAFLAGSYPAFYLSSFHPAKVMKGKHRAGRQAASPRKVLVVFQFSVSILLIFGTLIVREQIDFAKDRPVGYTKSGLISFRPASEEFRGKHDMLRSELKATGVVREIAGASYPITSTRGNYDGYHWAGKDPSFHPTFNSIDVTHEYGKTIVLEMLKGRDFSREYQSDRSAIIITESAASVMQMEEPIGQKVSMAIGGDRLISFTIIGMVRDLIKGSPFEPAVPCIMFLSKADSPWLFIRLEPHVSVGEALPKIQKSFHKVVPSAPFDYQFVDDAFSMKFREEEQVADLAGAFSLLAIFISCLGLFGLAAFVAERKTKEIGIRKVFGASIVNLWSLMSKEFVLLIGISIIISAPIGYFLLSEWLQSYHYHTEIGWGAFALSSMVAIAITLATVSFQLVKAATANPVDSLQSE